jgi:hypothetical protein
MGLRIAQLHRFEAHSREVGRHIAFRDYLRAHREAAIEYEKEKRHARDLYPNESHAYADEKAAWVQDAGQSGPLGLLSNATLPGGLRRRDRRGFRLRRSLVPWAGPADFPSPPISCAGFSVRVGGQQGRSANARVSVYWLSSSLK